MAYLSVRFSWIRKAAKNAVYCHTDGLLTIRANIDHNCLVCIFGLLFDVYIAVSAHVSGLLMALNWHRRLGEAVMQVSHVHALPRNHVACVECVLIRPVLGWLRAFILSSAQHRQ